VKCFFITRWINQQQCLNRIIARANRPHKTLHYTPITLHVMGYQKKLHSLHCRGEVILLFWEHLTHFVRALCVLFWPDERSQRISDRVIMSGKALGWERFDTALSCRFWRVTCSTMSKTNMVKLTINKINKAKLTNE